MHTHINYNSLCSLYQFHQLIEESTRLTSKSATLIDLILTNRPENISKSGVIHLGISDDYTWASQLKSHCARVSKKKTFRYGFSFPQTHNYDVTVLLSTLNLKCNSSPFSAPNVRITISGRVCLHNIFRFKE